MKCRHCETEVSLPFIDLGSAPPSNALLNYDDLRKPEKRYPLRVKVCEKCWLVQTEDYVSAGDLFFCDYAYFSSYSTSWLRHAETYVETISDRLNLSSKSFVIEIGANDGYLLQYFKARGIPSLGVEPTISTATAAKKKGINIIEDFFGVKLAQHLTAKDLKADLIIANNVLAHVPDINDFVEGLKLLLKPGGTITIEFPHLLCLIEKIQFDTIYHEHYSYLSLTTVARIFDLSGLCIYDVEKLSTHGGSLRIYACNAADHRIISDRVSLLMLEEKQFGLFNQKTYLGFQEMVDNIKGNLLSFLIEKKRAGLKVAAYGAAAKGNTLLNYSGIKNDLISFVCDAAPSKQGKFLPGSHIPILHPAELRKQKPDIVLILPWNIADEIVETHRYVADWDCKFYVAVPNIEIKGSE